MILAVVGGKGGVGKSTVAYNLAAHLDAVVVDADLAMADLPAGPESAADRSAADPSADGDYGNATVPDANTAKRRRVERRGPDLHDVLAGRAAPVEAVRESGPVDILPCGRSLAGARACDPTALVDAVEGVAREYGVVVVDCPAGLCGDVGLGLLVAEACVLVTEPTPAALGDAVRARALARELDAGLAAVALNRASADAPTDLVADRLGGPVTVVPDSPALADAQAAGCPVAAVAPGSAASDAFAELATRLESLLSRGECGGGHRGSGSRGGSGGRHGSSSGSTGGRPGK